MEEEEGRQRDEDEEVEEAARGATRGDGERPRRENRHRKDERSENNL